MGTILEVKDLETRFYTEDGTVHAVNGVSFTLDEGETLGVVGESGCGKSVTMLSLLRLIPTPPGKITGGEVLFEGRDLLKMTDDEIRQVRGNRIAMIFQDPMTSLNPVLTINRQVSEALELHLGMDKEQARKRTIELLTMVGIPSAAERIDDYPHQFSGGMRQRVMIAMALACRPRLLIADEPTTALDVTIQAQILDVMRKLVEEERMAMILITHALGVVAGVCERIAVMYGGRFCETAPTDPLFADPRHPYTEALLRAVPRVDQQEHQRLMAIDGLPPKLDVPFTGCPFAPRCDYTEAQCRAAVPSLRGIGAGRAHACAVRQERKP